MHGSGRKFLLIPGGIINKWGRNMVLAVDGAKDRLMYYAK